MNTRKLCYSRFVFAVGTFLCGGALAENCNGRYTNVNQFTETIDLGEGHTLTICGQRECDQRELRPYWCGIVRRICLDDPRWSNAGWLCLCEGGRERR